MSQTPLLLTTKFHLPPARTQPLPRARLLAQLAESLARPLTLIAAPAGFGKTTLLVDWIAHTGAFISSDQHPTEAARPAFCWLALDEGDNELTRFWLYVVAALQTVYPGLGADAMVLLTAPQPPPIKTILTHLLNELTGLVQPLVLILDDYHTVEESGIHSALTFLIDHLPPQLHIVLSTRADPPLPLARWRVRGQLGELRADELRFTASESADFLRQIMGLALAPAEIDVLEARTEGWAAGLQLAALSLQGVADTQRTIAAFGGSNRYIIDYLMEEVLNRQPESVRTFLLQTSILERLCGPLCDALLDEGVGVFGGGEAGSSPPNTIRLPPTPHSPSQEVLEHLDRTHLFLIPLDDERRWFRYHHLFADALQSRLRQAGYESVQGLHLRASAWYEQQDLLPEAIHHALAGAAFIPAARLIEQVGLAGFAQPVVQHRLGQWLHALPGEVRQTRPRLSLVEAWLAFNRAQFGDALQALTRAEAAYQQMEATASDPQMAGEIAALRAMVTTFGPAADLDQAYASAQAALSILTGERALFRSIAAGALAAVHIRRLDVAQVDLVLDEAIRMGRAAKNIHLTLITLINQAVIQRVRGALRQSSTTCEETLNWLAEQGAQAVPAAGGIYAILADLTYEQNELETARGYAEQALAHGERGVIPLLMAVSRFSLMQIQQAQGDWQGAWSTWRAAEQLIGQHALHFFRPTLAAVAARFQLGQGNLAQAWQWAQEVAWPEDKGVIVFNAFDLAYLIEHRLVARAQVYLAQGRATGDRRLVYEAVQQLERQRALGAANGWRRLEIKTCLLTALAHHSLGEAGPAAQALTQALSLAEPEGFVRLFVDEGEPLRPLLVKRRAQILPTGAGAGNQRLLVLMDTILAGLGHTSATVEHGADRRPASEAPAPHPLTVEPLSERELEVLRLVDAGLSNQEIANWLVVTVGTVKKHINNIFGKLGATHRTQAIVLARQYNLL
jgi:LuxR family transcriptional regulator, maltose regulon positive regulatory protein